MTHDYDIISVIALLIIGVGVAQLFGWLD